MDTVKRKELGYTRAGWQDISVEILLNIDDRHMSEAEEWIKKAMEVDSRNDMRWHLGRDYALYAELFKRKGDQPKVREKSGKGNRNPEGMRCRWVGGEI